MARKALVTFAIGEKYQKEFQNFKPSCERYFEKYGWDFIEVKELFEPVDERRFIICQKLLIACQEWSKKYDMVAWVDSDMWITDNCPEIPMPAPGKVGICIEQLMHHECLQVEVAKRRSWQTKAGEYYKRYGFEPDECPDWIMNAGLMAFRTDMDIRSMYDEMVEVVRKIPERAENGTLNHYEQPYLGWKLHNDKSFEIMDWRYNIVWPVYRGMFAEPYDRMDDLVKPMRNLFDFAYTIHYTDREDVPVLDFIKDKMMPMADKTLVVEQTEMMKAFSSAFRLCKFKRVIVRTKPEILQMMLPLQQFGWVIPNYIVASETEKGNLTVREVELQLGLTSDSANK
jgi:hypothetical protein